MATALERADWFISRSKTQLYDERGITFFGKGGKYVGRMSLGEWERANKQLKQTPAKKED